MISKSMLWILRIAVACVVSVSVLGCTKEAGAVAAAEAVKEVACPSQEFPLFLKVFVNDVEIQRAFTRYPYEATVYDPSDLEANAKTQFLDKDEIVFPVMLSEEEMSKHGVTMTRSQKEEGWFEVSTQSVGSGAYTMNFNFRHVEGCWFLTSSTDAST